MAIDFIAFASPWLPELVPMWREAFEFGNGIKDVNPLQAQQEYFLSEVLPRHQVTLAVEGSTLVGFLAASQESVSQLHVRVGSHRRGIGSALMERAKMASAGSLWLYTFTRNTNACRFYEKHGFVAVEYGFEPVWQAEDVKYRWVPARSAT